MSLPLTEPVLTHGWKQDRKGASQAMQSRDRHMEFKDYRGSSSPQNRSRGAAAEHCRT